MQKLLAAVMVCALLSVVGAAQEPDVPAKLGWRMSVHGYVWVGNHYFGGIADTVFDGRWVGQGAMNLVLENGQTVVLIKTWGSFSPERNEDGELFTGNAQEFDLGAELVRQLGRGWAVRGGYSHFFITKKAGSDIEMIKLAAMKAVQLSEHNTVTAGFEFYQFLPTSEKGPAQGRFYLPSVTFEHEHGSWSANTSFATIFNSNGALGFKSEPAVKVTGQLLYKLPKGKTGPDFVCGGALGSSQRRLKCAYGWSWIF